MGKFFEKLYIYCVRVSGITRMREQCTQIFWGTMETSLRRYGWHLHGYPAVLCRSYAKLEASNFWGIISAVLGIHLDSPCQICVAW